MANPGLTFIAQVVNGLVGEISWGEWESDSLETHAFGVEGASSVQGALVGRNFEVPLILQGYGSQLDRDSDIQAFERFATRVGSLQIRVAGGTVVFNQNANIKFLSLRRGKSGVDGIHGFWRNIVFVFRQLASVGSQSASIHGKGNKAPQGKGAVLKETRQPKFIYDSYVNRSSGHNAFSHQTQEHCVDSIKALCLE